MYAGREEIQPAGKNLPGLSTPVYLAKKVGEGLGRCEILQRCVQKTQGSLNYLILACSCNQLVFH